MLNIDLHLGPKSVAAVRLSNFLTTRIQLALLGAGGMGVTSLPVRPASYFDENARSNHCTVV